MSASKPKKVFKDLSSSTSTANSDQKKKREPYNKLSEEKKEEIGKRAAERGVKDTIDYYQNREDLNLKKRSVYQLKRKYAGGDLPEKNGEELEKNGEELEKNGEELEKNGEELEMQVGNGACAEGIVLRIMIGNDSPAVLEGRPAKEFGQCSQ